MYRYHDIGMSHDTSDAPDTSCTTVLTMTHGYFSEHKKHKAKYENSVPIGLFEVVSNHSVDVEMQRVLYRHSRYVVVSY